MKETRKKIWFESRFIDDYFKFVSHVFKMSFYMAKFAVLQLFLL